ncbi:MAG: DegT/DnrJ/EryC1/StrS family aminotransferase, partial [Bacteroidota bacterium]
MKLPGLTACEQARNKVAAKYDEAFAGHPTLQIPLRVKNSTHVFHQYTLKCNGIDRNALRTFLAGKKIPSMVYYPIPLHQQKAYRNSRIIESGLPVTEQLCACVISLPMSPELTEEQSDYI